MSESVIHLLPPLFDANSRVLILGTMPSPKSRQNGFYYAHPQNRFWRVLAAVCCESMPPTIRIAPLFATAITSLYGMFFMLAVSKVRTMVPSAIHSPTT